MQCWHANTQGSGGRERRRRSLAYSGLQSLVSGRHLSETINMRLKHIHGLLSAATMSTALLVGLSISLFISLLGAASAQDKTVKIGAIFPFSGNAASIGVHAKAAIETAVDIINNAHPELGNFPLAGHAGLAGLGGAKVEVVFADNQGSPAV